MILNSFEQHALVVQIDYKNAYELWDCAGAIGRSLCDVWGALEVAEGEPRQQVIKGEDLSITTGFTKSAVSLFRKRSASRASLPLIRKTFDIWKEFLSLGDLGRVGTRQIFYKEFSSAEDANKYVMGLGLVKMPKEKVFNQSEDSGLNCVEAAYRFRDGESFAYLKVKSESVNFHVELDRGFVDDPIDLDKHRVCIDFDRSTVVAVEAQKFRMDEWVNGCMHLLRRDIGKIIGD